MALLNFRKRDTGRFEPVNRQVEAFLEGYSIEVMPRTAEKIEDFRALLPRGTRVYVAHIDGTPIDDMVSTARRLAEDGYPVMPHFPARIIRDKAMLADWIARYQGEAGVDQALVLAGGVAQPVGEFDSSIQLLQTGLSTRPGSGGCTSRATPRATATSTRRAAPGTSTTRLSGNRNSRPRPMPRWHWPRSSPLTPGR